MAEPKTILISVTSDLVSDQRVHRAALTLHESGHRVVLAGRVKRTSPEMDIRPYPVTRFRLWFEKGPLFYAVFNIRLFFWLLFRKADLLLANDLDTLAANRLAGWIRRIPVVYDSHEYFTEVPELVSRPWVQHCWQWIERLCLPGVARMYTVNESIAGLYQRQYGIAVQVVRNVPTGEPVYRDAGERQHMREQLGLPATGKLLVLQGAGINIHRGAEEAVEAIRFLPDTHLLIIGGGDVLPVLKNLVTQFGLTHRVHFKPRMTAEQLIAYTASADLGLTLDKNTNLNYRFSLPNKLFDYIRAGIPVLASDLTEVKRIVTGYSIGTVIASHEPEALAACIRDIWSDPDRLELWKRNTRKAAVELNWAHEKKHFLAVFHGLL